MENVGIFYAHLEYIIDIWYALWSFGNFVVIWSIFPRFGILSPLSLTDQLRGAGLNLVSLLEFPVQTPKTLELCVGQTTNILFYARSMTLT
jgi:hypothetical protein